MISGEKILISGVTGIVAQPLAKFLAQNNEVWGLARFTADRKKEEFSSLAGEPLRALSPRAELEAAGITTRAMDLGDGDFSDLQTSYPFRSGSIRSRKTMSGGWASILESASPPVKAESVR